MNPVLILTHNCLELTKRCVESVRAQDIETYLRIFDNGSTDGTREWLEQNWCESDYKFTWSCHDLNTPTNKGVSYAWNHNLSMFFDPGSSCDGSHVLVINNDTILPPWFYRELLACNVPFVTGATSRDINAVMESPIISLTDGPDFSAFLIQREAWRKIGPFDESMVHYCSDIDYDIRARALGITLYNSHVKFYHERSSTIRLASEEDRAAIQQRSNLDHEAFRKKYGCLPKDYEWCSPSN